MSAENFFLEIQQAVIDRLDADATFDGIPILAEVLGDVDQMIEIVMGKIGICAIVNTPFANVTSGNTPGVFLNEIPLEIDFYEETTLNRRSGNTWPSTPMGLALNALGLLTHRLLRTPDSSVITNAVTPDAPTLVDLRSQIDTEKFPNIQAVRLRMRCSAGFNFTPTETLLDGNNQALLDGMGIKLTSPRTFLP